MNSFTFALWVLLWLFIGIPFIVSAILFAIAAIVSPRVRSEPPPLPDRRNWP